MTEADLQGNAPHATRLPDTGPVSRIVRLFLAALVAWLLVEWATAGLTWFSQPTTPLNPRSGS